MGCGIQILLVFFFFGGAALSLAVGDLVREFSREKLVETIIWLPIVQLVPAAIYAGIIVSVRRQEARGERTDAGGLSTNVWRYAPPATYILGAIVTLAMMLAGRI